MLSKDKIPKITSYASAARLFSLEIKRLRKLDIDAQSLTSGNLPVSRVNKLIDKSTEGILLSLFTEYEHFVESVLILSALEKILPSGRKPTSFLSPENYAHALDLIIGGREFGSWNSPDHVINTSERILKSGFPIKDLIVSVRDQLQRSHWVRNRIAHKSQKSQKQFLNAVKADLDFIPLNMTSVGNFLNRQYQPSGTRVIQYYMDSFESISSNLSNL